MRILMLSQFYAPIIGGEEQHVRTLSAALTERGHSVAVATLWHQGLATFELDQGVRVYRLRGTLQRARWLFSESGRRHVPPWPDPELTWALRRVVAREQPDIVHAHNWLIHAFLPLKAWSGAKLVLTLHDYSLVCAQKRLMYRDRMGCKGPGFKCLGCAADHYGWAKGVPTVLANWAMSAIERSAVDMFLTVSHATAVGNCLPGSKLQFQVIPNFVPDDLTVQRCDVYPRMTESPADGYLLFVGDLTYDKGIGVLLHAYGNLRDAPTLVLIGRQSADLPTGLPHNVVVMGSLPHEWVIEAYRRSSIVLAPSLVPETFGIAALEAMAMGKPVIASRIGGLPDVVVDGESGFLVPPGDAAALQAAIERLLADPNLRERMGQAAKERSKAFQASAVVPRIEGVYLQLLRNGSLN